MLLRAMEGDISTVTVMVRESISTLWQLGLEAGEWLREKLMYEVLNTQPPPQPPLGWEGVFAEPIETIDDFIKWIEHEFTIREILHRGQGSCLSDGRSVRNAYRLVVRLGLTGMPSEPIGNLTFNDELSISRNLLRLSLERRDCTVNEKEDGIGAGSDPAEDDQARGNGQRKRKSRGRPVDTDPKADKRI